MTAILQLGPFEGPLIGIEGRGEGEDDGGKLGVFRCDLAETGKCVEPFSTFVAFEAKASVSVWVFKWILTRE